MKNIVSEIKKKNNMEERKSMSMERKNRENLENKQTNRTSRKCGSISKELTCMYLGSHRRQDR